MGLNNHGHELLRVHLDFGLIADRDQMPDVHLIIQWLREELALVAQRMINAVGLKRRTSFRDAAHERVSDTAPADRTRRRGEGESFPGSGSVSGSPAVYLAVWRQILGLVAN